MDLEVLSVSNNTISTISGQSHYRSKHRTAGTASTLTVGGNAINTLVSSGTGGTVLGIASANISPVININGNTVFSLSTSLSNAATGTITPLVG
jgi:hypothetical protein